MQQAQRLPVGKTEWMAMKNMLVDLCVEYQCMPPAGYRQHPFVEHWNACLQLLDTQQEGHGDENRLRKLLSHVIAEFTLRTGQATACKIHVPGHQGRTFSRQVAERPLQKPDFLVQAQSKTHCSLLGKCKLPTSVPRSPTTAGKEGQEGKRCRIIRKQQDQKIITLKPRNLLSVFPGQWLDSAAMDAWLHGCHTSMKSRSHLLYIISAENDPDMAELVATKDCYAYLLLVLFCNNHWTCLFLNHLCEEVFYYNSQLSYKTAAKQLEPYRQAFPGYQVRVAQVPQQCDNVSCGVFVCWFCYCLLFCPELIDSLSCDKSAEMRAAILRQLLIWYVV